MPHVIEAAKTGRAKCRACGQPIAQGAQRFGERVPNPFADEGGETTNWFHVACAAFIRPEAFLELLGETAEPIADREVLEREARLAVAYRRVPRATSAGRAASGRATCRACKKTIDKGAWRITLMYYEDGRLTPGGFIHAGCSANYFETTDLFGRFKHFSPELSDSDLAEIRAELDRG
jgi:ribosomal protein L37AE/L43A